MKLCKDCAYCVPNQSLPASVPKDAPVRLELAGCCHPRNAALSLVDGTTPPRYSFASALRIGNRFFAWQRDVCGEPGRWFESKVVK